MRILVLVAAIVYLCWTVTVDDVWPGKGGILDPTVGATRIAAQRAADQLAPVTAKTAQ